MQTGSGTYRLSGLIAVLGLLTILVGLIVMIVLPGIRLIAWGLLLLGIILLGAAFTIDYRRVSRAITGRRGRFSTGTTVMASIFIGIVLLVNAISIGNYHRFDFTGLAQFTLTSQTKEVLGELLNRGTTHEVLDRMMTYSEFSEVVNLKYYQQLDNRYGFE